MYYSQFGEDVLLAEIFGTKDKGLCVEVGANDGVNDSTTMYFERIGWDCVLVEPNPFLCEEIKVKRTALLAEFAVSDKEGDVTLFVAEGAERAHGVSTINSDIESLEKIKSYGFSYKEVQVKSKTLDNILDDLNVRGEIDFISIDVEGHELEALRGFSLGRWKPKIVLMEDNSNYQDTVIRDYLKNFGYARFKRTGVNDWYAHENHRDLVNIFSKSCYMLGLVRGRLKVKIKACVKKVLEKSRKN